MKDMNWVKMSGLSLIIVGLTACSEKADDTVSSEPLPAETAAELAERELEAEKNKLAMLTEATRIAEEKAAMETKLAEAKAKEEEARLERIRQEEEQKQAAAKKKVAREKAREALNGTKLDVLKTTKGTTFKHVVINNVTPAALGIVHDSGAASIPFSELSTEWQKKVDYDPGEAQVFLDEETSKEKAYRKSVAANKKAVRQELNEAAAAAPKKTDLDLITEEEQKIQALVEKYTDLKNKAQVEVTKAYSKRDGFTRYSANWNTADKLILKTQGQLNEYTLQEDRYRALLREKETARYKLLRAEKERERREAREKNRAGAR